jgi:hypothetical protein
MQTLKFFQAKNLEFTIQYLGSALVSILIQIWLFTSIRIRIKGAKPLRIQTGSYLDPDQALWSLKYTFVGTIAFSLNFVKLDQFSCSWSRICILIMDPDPGEPSLSGSIRIWTHSTDLYGEIS